MTTYSGTRVGKRLGKLLSGKLIMDINEPYLQSLPGCVYVLDADNAHARTSDGKVDLCTDEKAGYVFSIAAPASTINTTSLPGHQVISGSGMVLGLDNATAAGAWNAGHDFTFHAYVKLGSLAAQEVLCSHSVSASGLPAVGAAFFDSVLTGNGTTGIYGQRKNNSVSDTATPVTFARDTTAWHLFTLVRSGNMVTGYYDGVSKGTATYSPGTEAPSGLTRISVGVGSSGLGKTWCCYSQAHDATLVAVARTLILERAAP